jgi:diphthine synthase
MHTLCLLDIKVKEPDFEAMMKGRTAFLPPRYMSVNTCCEQLIEAEDTLAEEAFDPKTTLCVGLARLGQESQQIVAGTMEELVEVDFGAPLHSFIVCGHCHDLELQVLKEFLLPDSKYIIDEPQILNDVAESYGDSEE